MAETRFVSDHATTLLEVSNPEEHLTLSLEKLVKFSPPENPWTGVYEGRTTLRGLFRGATSIAYLFLKLSKSQPALLISNKSPEHWCLAYLDCGQDAIPFEDPKDIGDELNIGITNEFLAFHSVKAAATQSTQDVDAVLQAIRTSSTKKGLVSEMFRGRAGALYLLRFIKRWGPQSTDKVNEVMTPLIEAALADGNPWMFHGRQYLGPIHGEVGVLTQIVLSNPAYAPKLQHKLAELLDLQLDSGNWAIRVKPAAEGKSVDTLVQFCHGAPGFVISLNAIRHFFPELEARIETAVQRAQQCIWERGVLTKEPSLCHGLTGNALAFEQWERREHFMAMTTNDQMEKALANGVYKEDDDAWGLLWGEAGRAWGWMELVNGTSQFPAYTDT